MLQRNPFAIGVFQVHETARKVRIFDGHKLVVEYDKRAYGAYERVRPLQGQHRRGLRTKSPPPSHEEQVLRGVDPDLGRIALRAALGEYPRRDATPG